MIEIIVVDGRSVPKVFCDTCGDEIAAAGEGAVVFRNYAADGEKPPVTYVHKDFVKGDCMSRAERSVVSSGERSGWIELGQYLAYLANNVGLSGEDIDGRLSSPQI